MTGTMTDREIPLPGPGAEVHTGDGDPRRFGGAIAPMRGPGMGENQRAT
ncbi:MAG: hypothetical protein ABWX73_13570 [Marmoricola sp.]